VFIVLLITHGDAQFFQKSMEVRAQHARFFSGLGDVPVVSLTKAILRIRGSISNDGANIVGFLRSRHQ